MLSSDEIRAVVRMICKHYQFCESYMLRTMIELSREPKESAVEVEDIIRKARKVKDTERCFK